MVKDKDGKPQEDLLVVVHCLCGTGGPLEGLLGVSRSIAREFLSVLSIGFL